MNDEPVTAPRCHPLHCILPDYVLRNIAEHGDEDERRYALDALATSTTLRSTRVQAEARRSVAPPSQVAAVAAAPAPERIIRDAKGTRDLRAPVVRSEGQDPVDDPAVNEAFERIGDTWSFFWEIFARNSIDQQEGRSTRSSTMALTSTTRSGTAGRCSSETAGGSSRGLRSRAA